MLKRTALVFALTLGGIATEASAYGEGGHYDTLVSLVDHDLTNDAELRLETFCSELPDLAREFDATTQRILVLFSPFDLRWGAFGACDTPRSEHMVSSQYYLHGLSGAPTDKVREAAGRMVEEIDTKLQQASAAERPYLVCARGMALHLFGDSFAHARLSRERGTGAHPMYPTGLGHARDGLRPDYLYDHENPSNQWPAMARGTAALLPAPARLDRVLTSHRGCNDASPEQCNRRAVAELSSTVDLQANRNEIKRMSDRFATDGKGIGNTERAKACQAFFDEPHAPAKLNCEGLWNRYLQVAVPVFRDAGIDPTARPHAEADASCTAWRCSAPRADRNHCDVVITDRVKYGE